MEVRPARPEEHAVLGELTVDAYAAIDPDVLDEAYAAELRDVAGRAEGAEVLVAVDGGGRVVGGVTYVPGPESSLAEFDALDAAGIRMLAAAESARGRGVGEALVRACIDAARVAGRGQIVLHSTDWMPAAQRLYLRLGFRRDPVIDVEYAPGRWLRGFRLSLAGTPGG